MDVEKLEKILPCEKGKAKTKTEEESRADKSKKGARDEDSTSE